MSKNTIIIVSVLLGIAILLLFVLKVKAQPVDPKNGTGTGTGTGIGTQSADSDSPTFPLVKGSKGTAVKLLQILVGVTPDGDFGSITEAASVKALGTGSISKEMFVAKCVDGAAGDADFPLTVGENSNYIQALQALLHIRITGTWGDEMTQKLSSMVLNSTCTAADYIRIVKDTLSL